MVESFEYVPTVCPYCGCGCGMYLVVKDGRIVGTEPWKDHPVNEGKNCPKGRNAYAFLYNEGRLKTPLIKKNGDFKEASWEKALELVAERLKAADGDSAGFINSGKIFNEDLYVFQKFVRVVMKTNMMDNCSRFCHSTTVPALVSTVGSGVMPTSLLSIERADCIMAAGSNTQETHPLIFHKFIRAKQRGAKVIVIDPRRTVTARNIADIFLQINPGSDVALINGMMKTIIEEGLEDKEFIEKRTRGFRELKNYLSSLQMSEVERITGIPADMIREAARTYANAETSFICFNAGITQHSTGVENIKALADLALLTGNYGKPGAGVSPFRGHGNGEGFGDMGPLPVFYPGFKPVNEETAKLFEELWGVKGLPSKPGMPYMDILEKCSVLYIVGGNPMVSAPDTNRVRKILESKEFLVVQDIFLTETAELADVILPAATWVEKGGTMTGIDRKVQRINKAVEPPGEAKPDWQILCDLAKVMGYGEYFNFNSTEEIFEEIRKCVPQYHGITYERLKKAGGIQWPCPSEDHPGTETMFVEKFATEDGFGHFQVVEYKPPLEVPDEDYPYVFMNGRTLFHFHTGTMTRRTSRLHNEQPDGFVEINAEDAEKLGIRSGDRVVLRSRRGEVKAFAKVTKNIQQGVVFMPFHFSECAANFLTGPTAGPPSRMPEFKYTAIKVEKVV
ncbi:MAG: formate dehydrogenase subunit alpha [Candidatus Freyrarchaeum guaymaensis]|nr:formate dehydrogenase subunit alpha [Candidatus Sigynarchaeota archaeon]